MNKIISPGKIEGEIIVLNSIDDWRRFYAYKDIIFYNP